MPFVRNRIAEIVALAVFASLLIVVGAHHEPWFDEAQAWLIAREGAPWWIVTHGVRYEGTPALWHLLLWTVQRLGLPYGGLWLVSSALACGGAWVMLFRSPFPLAMRIGLIFSYFFAYQYSIVARSYALDLLFVPLLAWHFEKRLERPLLYALTLGLVANTNAHSFVLAGVLLLEFAWAARRSLLAGDKRLIGAVALYGGLALAAAIQAWPPRDINFIIRQPGDNPLLHAIVLFTEAFIERGDIWALTGPKDLWRVVGGLLTLAVLIPAAMLWIEGRRIVLAAAMFGGLVAFSALKYGNYWHAGIVFLTFVFCLWIAWDARSALTLPRRRWLTVALSALLGFQVWCAAAAGVRDLATPYSGAPAAARAIVAHRRAHPGETMGVVGFKGFAVQPWFARNAFASYEGGAAKPAYYLWRQAQTPIPGLSEDRWRTVLKGGYDRALLSTFNVMGWNGPARYITDAAVAGYCPTEYYPGGMVWKTYELESDDLMIFDRCPPRPGAALQQPALKKTRRTP
jgi:hypothetical protein